jgi:hypothetical protein
MRLSLLPRLHKEETKFVTRRQGGIEKNSITRRRDADKTKSKVAHNRVARYTRRPAGALGTGGKLRWCTTRGIESHFEGEKLQTDMEKATGTLRHTEANNQKSTAANDYSTHVQHRRERRQQQQ